MAPEKLSLCSKDLTPSSDWMVVFICKIILMLCKYSSFMKKMHAKTTNNLEAPGISVGGKSFLQICGQEEGGRTGATFHMMGKTPFARPGPQIAFRDRGNDSLLLNAQVIGGRVEGGNRKFWLGALCAHKCACSPGLGGRTELGGKFLIKLSRRRHQKPDPQCMPHRLRVWATVQ